MKPSSTKTYRRERRRADLTDREKRILRLVCDGLSNTEIARRLATTPDVVKSSLLQIFREIDGSRRDRPTQQGLDRPKDERASDDSAAHPQDDDRSR